MFAQGDVLQELANLSEDYIDARTLKHSVLSLDIVHNGVIGDVYC